MHPSLWPRLAQRSAAIAAAYTTCIVAESVAAMRRGAGVGGDSEAVAVGDGASAGEADGSGSTTTSLFADTRDWRRSANGTLEALLARLVDVARRSEALRALVLRTTRATPLPALHARLEEAARGPTPSAEVAY